MRLNLKTAPKVEPIVLEQAKTYLRVDTSADDSLISALIVAARQLAEAETKRAFITQTWLMVLDSAPAEIRIPKPPLQKVVKISVISSGGTETEVKGKHDADASQGQCGRIKLKSGCVWPDHRGFASFIIEFDAGYGDGAENVPADIRQAILQIIGHLYENRGSQEIPAGAKALLWNHKVFEL